LYIKINTHCPNPPIVITIAVKYHSQVGKIGKRLGDGVEHLGVAAAGFITKITHRWTYRPKVKVNMFKVGGLGLPMHIEVRDFKMDESGERRSQELE
jgi:hypothetical protein